MCHVVVVPTQQHEQKFRETVGQLTWATDVYSGTVLGLPQIGGKYSNVAEQNPGFVLLTDTCPPAIEFALEHNNPLETIVAVRLRMVDSLELGDLTSILFPPSPNSKKAFFYVHFRREMVQAMLPAIGAFLNAEQIDEFDAHSGNTLFGVKIDHNDIFQRLEMLYSMVGHGSGEFFIFHTSVPSIEFCQTTLEGMRRMMSVKHAMAFVTD